LSYRPARPLIIQNPPGFAKLSAHAGSISCP